MLSAGEEVDEAGGGVVAEADVDDLGGVPVEAGRLHAQGTDRAAVLGTVAEEWARLDPARFPFVHRVGAQLPEHDDRDQFLTGVDLFVTGIVTARA
ncbi:hypothetical protein ACFWNI_14525 [Streptomyces sp. NPDC058377]|uniref:hypothetical protein n=1 Tax=Streptomyces sp. NPDC058377 TaxID=3346468 RepID=UPI0036584EF5